MAPVARKVPLIFGETGETFDGSDCGSSNIETFLNWADPNSVGYAAWTWDTWGNCQSLISNYDGTAANGYGMFVEKALRRRGRPATGRPHAAARPLTPGSVPAAVGCRCGRRVRHRRVGLHRRQADRSAAGGRPPVRALSRSDGRRSASASAEASRSPVSSPTPALRAAADGCELAFHAAATLGDWGRREEFERGNVQGTANVLRACAESGVRRLVHVGTEAALLAGEPLVEVDETAPLRPDSPALYSSTKARAEQLVLDANRDGFETVVIRPRFVWGRGDTTLLPTMVELVRSGRFAWIGGGRHHTSTTHVDNTVEGLVLGASRGAPGNVYFVTDGDPVEFRAFVTDLLATQGVASPSRNVPGPAAHALAVAGETAWRVLPLPGHPPLTRFAFWVSSQECTIRIDKAREQLGYVPRRTIRTDFESWARRPPS